MKKSTKKIVLLAALLLIVLAVYFLLSANNDTAMPDSGYSQMQDNDLTLLDDGESSVPDASDPQQTSETQETQNAIGEDGVYTSKDDVALYLHTYGHLPANFITKNQAESFGWSGGGLDKIPNCQGKSIGGDKFGNREGLLPDAPGRTYRECDIDTMGANSRGTKRIVFSNDGLIYYTDDHYDSFELLYGQE